MNSFAMFGLSDLFGRCKTKGSFQGILSLIFLFLFSFFLTSCKPTAVITADPQSGPAPLRVEFDGSGSTDWNKDIISYEWDFDGDGTIDMEGITATYTYQDPNTYTAKLIVTDKKGNTSEATQEIRVYRPPTVSIEADPLSIISGESSTLSWASTDATSASISPGIGSVEVNGSRTISPIETTTYTINATGSGGSATDSVTVTVYQPPTVNIFASPGAIVSGESTTLSWTSANADSVSIDQGIGSVDTDGSMVVSPTETITYTITATGSGGSATDSVIVTVYYPPTVNISVNPGAILVGGSATLSWASTSADTASIDNGVGSVDTNGSISVSPSETTTYTIIVTGPGGSATDSVSVIVYQPPTVNISADPVTIIVGESTTLSWTSTNADSVSIDQGIGSVGTNGSMIISPIEITTYTITATGQGGTAADSVTVTVYYPPTVNISTNPDAILAGESATLSWTSTDATSASISPAIGLVEVDGSRTISPTETTTYTITATGPGGSATDSVTVTVYQLPTVSISASPGAIVLGEPTTLSWTSTNADSVSIDQGIGGVGTNGSMIISPIETTTYTITATGPGGSATDSVTVTVYTSIPEVNISASPKTISQGGVATLTWTSSNTSSAFIDQGIGEVSLNGSIEVSPLATTTYTIMVTGPLGAASAKTNIMVSGDVGPQPEGSFGEQYEDLIPIDATVESYDSKRFSVITGLVQDLNEFPIADVGITIHSHPEYGTATTDAGGMFSIPVEGGTTMTVIYRKDGFLTLQRQVYVPWNDIAVAETVAIIPEDSNSSVITFDGNPDTVLTHKSSMSSDVSGQRSCTMVFIGDTHAYAVDVDGDVILELPDTITVRATEYTVGENGPKAMPAILPPTVAYTYCVELSVDGVERVQFDRPVITWVDNFLGFDVGMIVPVGYYNRDKGVWEPEDNGVVVKLLDTDSDGTVDALDATGDDNPDDLDDDGEFSDEVVGLDDPERYQSGATFWRVECTHFSSVDYNWPWYFPEDAISPNPLSDPNVDILVCDIDDCITHTSSFVEDRSRIFHEDVSISGTDMALHYTSSRVEGYHHRITVPASGETIPDVLKRIIVRLEVAGRTFEQILDPLPNQMAEFVWDGKDCQGRLFQGFFPAYVRVGFVYDGVYGVVPSGALRTFGLAGVLPTFISLRQEIVSWKQAKLTLRRATGSTPVAGGWSLTPHHHLFPVDIGTLYKGDGTVVTNIDRIIDTLAYVGSYIFGVAVDAEGNIYTVRNAVGDIDYVYKIDPEGNVTSINGSYPVPTDVFVDSKGNIYISCRTSSSGRNCIRKISSKDGSISILVETGYGGMSAIRGVCADSYGNVYYTYYHCIYKIDPNGIICRIAGNGTQGNSGDNGPAIDAQLYNPRDVTVDALGNIYIVSYDRIRKVDTSGIITTVAGGGSSYDDGISATQARITPSEIAVDVMGNLYIAEDFGQKVRKVDTNGIITTVAGNGNYPSSGDGGPATQAQLYNPEGVGVDPQGNIFIAGSASGRIRKVSPAALSSVTMAHMEEGDIPFVEEGLGYIFDSAGYHKETIDLDTGAVLYEFGYDEDKKLVSITDRFGDVTTIEYNGSMPTAIISPDGVRTTLTIDEDNHLTHITNPDGTYYQFEYTEDGLMTAKVEPKGNRFEHFFDDAGRLTDVTNQEGGNWHYLRQVYENGDILTEVLTGEDNLTSYLDHTDSTGAYTSIITGPTGAETDFSRSAGKLHVEKLLPCGMDLSFDYGLDSEFKFKYIKQMTETTAGLQRVTGRDRIYGEDADEDGIPDLITDEATVNGKITTLETDTVNSIKTLTTPEERALSTYYDPDTLLITDLFIPGLYEIIYGYDGRGRPVLITAGEREVSISYVDSVQGHQITVTDPLEHEATYHYDALDRLIQIDRPDANSIYFDYDANGNMTVLTTPSSIDHVFGYNAVNLNSLYQTPVSGNYSYEYNKDRQLTRIEFSSGKEINNLYDNTRLIRIQTPEDNIDVGYICGSKVGSVTRGTEGISYGYDGSLLTSETISGTLNQSLGYSYNNDFNLANITYADSTVGLIYDNDGLLAGCGDFTISRNAENGLPEGVADGGLNLDRIFNGYGELSNQGFTVNGSSLHTWGLSFNDIGRITQKTETIEGTTSTYGYTYDPMGRLLTVTKDGTLVEEYQYGPNGTRIYEMNTLKGITTPRTLSYSDEDQLLTAGDTTYTYDVDGFLKQKMQVSDITAYTYSTLGELLSVNLPDGTSIGYVYDPLGRRIAKKVDGVITEKYLWQGLTRLLTVYDGNDNLKQRFLYADGRMPVAVEDGEATYYLSYDQVGSLRLVVDATGNVQKQIDYDTFGYVINDTNPLFEVPFGFAGGLYDGDTGLVRFGFRDYDPDTGRWTAKDPILFAGGDTDLYGYCLNDPVNLVDPEGLFWGTVLNFGLAAWVGASAGGPAELSFSLIGSAAGAVLFSPLGPIGSFVGAQALGKLFGMWGSIYDSDGSGELNYGEEYMLHLERMKQYQYQLDEARKAAAEMKRLNDILGGPLDKHKTVGDNPC